MRYQILPRRRVYMWRLLNGSVYLKGNRLHRRKPKWKYARYTLKYRVALTQRRVKGYHYHGKVHVKRKQSLI